MDGNDLVVLDTLKRNSTPERWAAFLALARYMSAHPDQRLGQAVVTATKPAGSLLTLFYMPDDDTRRRAEAATA